MLRIGNARLNLTLSPDYGARVQTLTDKLTGREWLVTGPDSPQTAEDAVYGSAEAIGWDECFPTVGVCEHPGWQGRLRDHGALWGRPWAVDLATDDCIETRFETDRFRFLRRLTATGASILADYVVTNLGAAPLPYLWSQHCLLAARPGDRIILNGAERLLDAGRPFPWPHHPARDLTHVGAPDDGFALKAYSDTPHLASAGIEGPDGGIRLDWDDLPAFGLWLSYGGWPETNPVQQVALEPTTAAADDLTGAEARGQARWLDPNQTHRWSVRMTLTTPEERTRHD